jgi:hypothetical protein
MNPLSREHAAAGVASTLSVLTATRLDDALANGRSSFRLSANAGNSSHGCTDWQHPVESKLAV